MKRITLQILMVLAFGFTSQANAKITDSFEKLIPGTSTFINNSSTNGWFLNSTPFGAAHDEIGVASITYDSVVIHDDSLILLPPTNDDCANAINLDPFSNNDGSCTLTYLTSNVDATFSTAEGAPSGACVDGDATPADIWFTYTVPASGAFDFEFISNPGFSTIVELYTGSCGSLTAWAPVNCANTLNRTFDGLTPGATVYLRVWDYNSDEESTFEICVNYLNCTSTVVESSAVIPNCGSNQFSVDVVVTSVNDGTFIVDDLGGMFVVSAGTVTAGPYADASIVTLTVEHSDDACNFSLGDFSNTCGPSEACSTYSSSPGLPIDDANDPSDVITVSGTGPRVLLDLDVIVKIDHTYLGDLNITLTSPTNTVVTLMELRCSGNNNMDIQFDDEGTTLVCSEPTIGVFTPDGLLSDFDNEIFDGDWTLDVVDGAGGDNGTLIQWCLVPSLNTLGVEEVSLNSFTYYPNPVSHYLTLKGQNAIQNVSVYNMLGQEVMNTEPNVVYSELDMSKLYSGAYFVTVTIGDSTKTIRVIKN